MTNYAALWLEVGGEQHRRGWYKLPSQEIKKSLEEVKSKHRSQFIKRESLKELAQHELAASRSSLAGVLTPVNLLRRGCRSTGAVGRQSPTISGISSYL